MTATEEKTLQMILNFGGYISTELLSLWRPDIHYRNHAYMLQRLSDEKLLIARPEYRYGKTPLIYQVTRRACSYFGRQNSYLRNKHKLPHVHRALVRGYYLFGLVGSGYAPEDILCYSEDRIQYFLNLGIRKQILPAKTNGEIRKTQIDEHILLKSPHTGEAELTILHTHKPYSDEWKQLHSLMEGYILLSQQRNCPPLTVLVICEREDQVIAYRRASEQKMKQHRIRIEVQSIGKVFFLP